MFEDFSFSSPSSTRPPRLALDSEEYQRLTLDHDSGLISPLSSRCPSPRSSTQRFPRTLSRSRSSYSRGQAQAPTSVPFSAYEKRFSISTLTKKLHEHTLQNQSGTAGAIPSDDRFPDAPISPTSPSDPHFSSNNPKLFPGYVLTPPDTDLDDDSHTSGSLSPTFPPSSSSPYLNPTSAPAASDSYNSPTDTTPMDLNADDQEHNYTTMRAQRQHISRLQYCNPTDLEAIRLALISEDEALRTAVSHSYSTCEDDWHPSSLPPQSSPRRRALTASRGSRFRPVTESISSTSSVPSSSSLAEYTRSRRKSSVSALQSSHRIEKSYQLGSTRDLQKKSEQGLRRKSLVSAALASMVE
ncbi:uncharacterized protein BO95DRAFT_430471 [Aspergillus brunneoviolaceus CBS 621.78]|uniref:Uncharacterized protein n=1 Tax=Aspergillus brunneoviolaceus CBS 621.78 TaxID=1450534 RepID=A0ACD1GDI1_9EURO|nr:hypothetical protein BO95DRAFT_430471 [Aspergillus brunneoviolaceus CBS 621.78]RAH47179.1 hypothetical protein BO95DRAFT_430471 [Aspergillus brunneoviolaceus CBS 621.78]